MSKYCAVVAMFTIAFTSIGCGPGGILASITGGKETQAEEPDRIPLGLTQTVEGIKTLHFEWNALPAEFGEVDFYRFAGDVAGLGSIEPTFTPDNRSFSVDVATHLFDWGSAVFEIEIVTKGTQDSPSRTLLSEATSTSDTSLENNSIGYFKSVNTSIPNPEGVYPEFGSFVAFSGNGRTLAVGSPGEFRGGVSKVGSVHLFLRDGTSWTYQDTVVQTGSIGSNGDEFGSALALSYDGRTLAVGAPSDDMGASNSGAVYMYRWDSGTWTEDVKLKATMPEGEGYFGSAKHGFADSSPGCAIALSSDGNALVVGSSRLVDPPSFGSIHTFVRDGNGLWMPLVNGSRLEGVQDRDKFGQSVSLSEDGKTMAVGAYLWDRTLGGPIEGDVGAVFVYSRQEISAPWGVPALLDPMDTDEGDGFGCTVSLSGAGDLLAVGAWEKDSHGAVYVYSRSGSNWTLDKTINQDNPGVFDQFGKGLSLSANGEWLAVGFQDSSEDKGIFSTEETNESASEDSGAVCLFRRNGGEWDEIRYIKSPNSLEDDLFGEAVALSPDGAILVVGAPREDGIRTGENGGITAADGAYDFYAENSSSPGFNSGAVFVY